MPAPESSLICATDAIPSGQVNPGRDVPVAVWEVLSTITDVRDRRGLRHDLATVLVLAVGAVVAGARTLAAIAGWAADLPAWAARRSPRPACALSRSTVKPAVAQHAPMGPGCTCSPPWSITVGSHWGRYRPSPKASRSPRSGQ